MKPDVILPVPKNHHLRIIYSDSTLSIPIHGLRKPNKSFTHNLLQGYRVEFPQKLSPILQILFLAKYFSFKCFKIKIASVIQRPGLNPNCT